MSKQIFTTETDMGLAIEGFGTVVVSSTDELGRANIQDLAQINRF